jgi:CRISPR-associated endonuclease Cas1 subtype II
MSWRTVVISKRCKLDLKLGYMVVRGEETRRVFLDEIAVVILENPAISMTGCLLNALTDKKIKVILCDDRHNPVSELMPLYGAHDSTRKLRWQLAWEPTAAEAVWTKIVGEKIRQQAYFLKDRGKIEEFGLLMTYLSELEPADAGNREGFAAKVYFRGIFGPEFSRGSGDPVNGALNYGYAVLLSAFNREVTAGGYLTQLGIHHDNTFNPYNLSCDFMEPFRILVDRKVYEMEFSEFSTQEKHSLLEFLNQTVIIAGAKQTVLNAITVYTRSLFSALNQGDVSQISFYSLTEEK